MGLATIFVLGAGNFGTSLAGHLGKIGHEVVLWHRSTEVLRSIAETRRNDKYLSDLQLPATVTAASGLKDVKRADLLLLSVPSHALREMLGRLQPHLASKTIIVSTLKGLEVESNLFPRQIALEVLGEQRAKSLVVLSGPSFAVEVAKEHPTCVSIASDQPTDLLRVQEIFHTNFFRVYTCDDPIGLEVAGAFKNVIAIAAGACVGLGFGANSKAALITRGLAEMIRFGVGLGAKSLTFSGLSGIGDLFLTCSSEKSRNYMVGYKLGQGLTIAEIQATLNSVAEGVRTSRALHELAKQHQISTPIVDEVFNVLYRGKAIAAAVDDLLQGQAKAEFDW